MKESEENMPDGNQVFKKFSLGTRKILISAQKIAQNMNTNLGSEHILLALAITPGTLAHAILQEHLISLDQIRLVISLTSVKRKLTEPGISAEAKVVLKTAMIQAKNFQHYQVDPEHLLLALVSNEDCVACQIILRIGSDPAAIETQINNLFEDISELEKKSSEQPKMPFNLPPFHFEDFSSQSGAVDLPAGELTTTKSPLDYFTINLSKQAKEGKIDPVIGRQKEIQRVIQILSRRTKNNPVLVGEPGVGKTAIVEGLAQRINDGQVPNELQGKQIIMLDLALLVAGTMYRGQFEDRIKKVMEEILHLGNIILFVDELHTVVGAGSAEGSLDAANILKPALSKGKLHLIGATTDEEYRKVIEKDGALERRFQKVYVPEATASEAMEILKGLRPYYESFHQVKIADEAITAAVNLSKRYIPDRFLPDKAIDLIDEAAAAGKLKNGNQNERKILNIQKQLNLVRQQKEQEVEKQNFRQAAELKELECRLHEEINQLNQTKPTVSQKTIGESEIARVVSLWTNVPVESLTKSEKSKYLNLAQHLKKHIIGQDKAILEISQAIRRAKTGITDPNRPIGSFVFLGPTGVGKTELARVLAGELFGSRDSMIKIDMSEFMERHNISRLVGAPPGYVGYEEAGRLTEEVRKNPYSIVLFDEIEKAHPEIFNILLQILEDGQLTDAKGKIVNFRNTIIILTSNIGVKELNQQAVIGFQATGHKKKKAREDYEKMKNDLVGRLKQELRPELVNRLDKIIVFHALDKKDILKIIDLNLDELKQRLANQGYTLEFLPKVKEIVAKHGYDPEYGARPVRRAIADLIEDPLSEKILEGKVKKGDQIQVSFKQEKMVFENRLKKR